MLSLRGKTALITGGTSGIGFATARRFLVDGARVAITGTNAGRLKAAQRELGGEVLPLRVDAADLAGQIEIAHTLAAAFGTLDAVFINAGLVALRAIEDWDEAGFDRSVSVNLKGPFFLIQALLPVLARPASIVLNTAVDVQTGAAHSAVYAATKAGLISLARTLSAELIGRGIRVNAVSPGPIATALHRRVERGAEGVAALVQKIPAGRLGEPDEVAAAVAFLVSDASAFVIGSEFVIDGGMSWS